MHFNPSSLLALALVTCALAVAPARHGLAQDTDRPVLLVANPQLGAFYAHTVLIAVPIGRDQHAGLIINRPTERSLSSLFPEHEPSRKVVKPVYLGGPVMGNSLFAVVRTDEAPDAGSMPFIPGLFLVSHARTIDHIIETRPNDARYYVGFVAWKPGELEEELQRGFWYAMQPEAELLFRDNSDGMWEELVKQAGESKTKA
jgi:putative transcriptional regulator